MATNRDDDMGGGVARRNVEHAMILRVLSGLGMAPEAGKLAPARVRPAFNIKNDLDPDAYTGNWPTRFYSPDYTFPDEDDWYSPRERSAPPPRGEIESIRGLRVASAGRTVVSKDEAEAILKEIVASADRGETALRNITVDVPALTGADPRFSYVAPVTGEWAPSPNNTFHASRGYDPVKNPAGRQHSGNDIRAPKGAKAVAAIGGQVIYADRNKGYGWNAVVLGDDGNAYRYATHGPLAVNLGQTILQGETIGTIDGMPGGIRPHLHFEIIPPVIDGAPNEVFEKMVANPGEFVDTQFWPSRKQPPATINPAAFFGVEYGTNVAAGEAFGDPKKAAAVVANPMEVADPFGVGAMQAAEAAAGGNVPHTEADVQAMADMAWREAKGEGTDGMRGVLHVAVNRSLEEGSRWYGKSLGSIVNSREFAQGKVNRNTPEWREAYDLAQLVVSGADPDNTNGATYFANPKTAERGALRQITRAAEPVAAIGAHVFYGNPAAGPAVAAVAPQFFRGPAPDVPEAQPTPDQIIAATLADDTALAFADPSGQAIPAVTSADRARAIIDSIVGQEGGPQLVAAAGGGIPPMTGATSVAGEDVTAPVPRARPETPQFFRGPGDTGGDTAFAPPSEKSANDLLVEEIMREKINQFGPDLLQLGRLAYNPITAEEARPAVAAAASAQPAPAPAAPAEPVQVASADPIAPVPSDRPSRKVMTETITGPVPGTEGDLDIERLMQDARPAPAAPAAEETTFLQALSDAMFAAPDATGLGGAQTPLPEPSLEGLSQNVTGIGDWIGAQLGIPTEAEMAGATVSEQSVPLREATAVTEAADATPTPIIETRRVIDDTLGIPVRLDTLASGITLKTYADPETKQVVSVPAETAISAPASARSPLALEGTRAFKTRDRNNIGVFADKLQTALEDTAIAQGRQAAEDQARKVIIDIAADPAAADGMRYVVTEHDNWITHEGLRDGFRQAVEGGEKVTAFRNDVIDAATKVGDAVTSWFRPSEPAAPAPAPAPASEPPPASSSPVNEWRGRPYETASVANRTPDATIAPFLTGDTLPDTRYTKPGASAPELGSPLYSGETVAPIGATAAFAPPPSPAPSVSDARATLQAAIESARGKVPEIAPMTGGELLPSTEGDLLPSSAGDIHPLLGSDLFASGDWTSLVPAQSPAGAAPPEAAPPPAAAKPGKVVAPVAPPMTVAEPGKTAAAKKAATQERYKFGSADWMMQKLMGGPFGLFGGNAGQAGSGGFPSASDSSFWTQPNFDPVSGGSTYPYHQIGNTGTGYYVTGNGTVYQY